MTNATEFKFPEKVFGVSSLFLRLMYIEALFQFHDLKEKPGHIWPSNIPASCL
jgi:hypothetical protein